MNTELLARSSRYFGERLNTTLEAMLQPIDGNSPAGYPVKSNGVYQTIRHAKQEDDPSLSRGQWDYELKRADWPMVSRTATDALLHKSKDLQVATWLLEAQVHQIGFSAVAPSLLLIEGLLRSYWDSLYPQINDKGCEHRANILRSTVKTVTLALKQQPLTQAGVQREYSLIDWESAQYLEQIKARASLSSVVMPEEEEAVTLADLTSTMHASATAWYQALELNLLDALSAMAQLKHTVDERFAHDAPSLSGLSDVLLHLHTLVQAELHRRGVPAPRQSDRPDSRTQHPWDESSDEDQAQPNPTVQLAAHSALFPANDRAQAYAMLEQASHMLMQLDPHSPAPYLVQRAVAWGRLNTAELYHEVFIRLGGQINVFELLGIETKPEEVS